MPDVDDAGETVIEPDAYETTEPETVEPVETVKEPETGEPVGEPAAEPVANSVALGEAKNLAEANTEPETEPAVADEAANEPEVGETADEPETVEPVEEPVANSVALGEAKNLAEANAEPDERQSEAAEESVPIIDDEFARFKAATEGFDRLEKFTFKIFKDVFDNYSGVTVTARQTLADLLLFIAAKCKNAGKIEDFKRAFNIEKDFDKLNQSAANYIPVLLNLTLKLKAQSDFVSGVFNEIRGILLNIIRDETAVEFELKILKQLLF